MGITRDQLLAAASARDIREYDSKALGGIVKYRMATMGDKGSARRRAMVPSDKPGEKELDNERLECALVQMCLVEPKLEPQDLDALLALPARDIQKLAALIIGTTDPN